MLSGKTYYNDKVGFKLQPYLYKMWAVKGEQKFIEDNGYRGKLNVCGFVDIDNGEFTYSTIEKGNTLNFASCLYDVYLLNKNLCDNGSGINIILDNVPFHKAPRIRNMCNALNINLVLLPVYSPDYNPIERCWWSFRQKHMKNVEYESV